MKKYQSNLAVPVTLFLILLLLLTRGLSGQALVTKDLPQYLFSDFSSAEVKMKKGNTIYLDLNYNTATEKMVFKMNEKLFDMVNPESSDTVFLQDRLFIPFDTIFLEVITKGEIAFYIQHSSVISLKSKPTMTGTTQVSESNYYAGSNSATVYFNEKLPSNLSVKPSKTYWVKTSGSMKPFSNERQLLKIFPANADSLKSFIKKEGLRISDRSDLIRIGKYCSSFTK